MALTRSFSGPGGLSINTNSANSLFSGSGTTQPSSGGMFGSTQAAKPSTGLFGAPATTPAPQSGGLFGSTASAAPSTGGLFGSAPAAATSAPATGGLFGAAPAQPATGGLFGNANTSQPASTGGGLFGSTTAATTAPAAGGLFGSATTNNNQTQGVTGGGLGGAQSNNQTTGANTGGGLFGGTASSQPAQNGGGLFGNLNQAKPAASGGLFGASQQTQTQTQSQPQQTSSLFGAPAQNQPQGQTNNNMLGGSRFMGQSQQPQLVPGVQIDLSQMRGTTRFNDLNETVQKQIEHFDQVIQAQIAMKNDCDAIMPQHGKLLEHIPNDVEFCRRKLLGMEEAMERDATEIDQVRQLIKKDADNATLSFRAIDNQKLPTQYQTPGIWANKSTNNPNSAANDTDAQDLVSFFSATADELDATLKKYQNNFTELEAHLRSLEQSTAQQTQALLARRNGRAYQQENQIQELGLALVEFEQSILQVAGKIGASRESIQALQLGSFTGPGDRDRRAETPTGFGGSVNGASVRGRGGVY
ncbi:uncharacterized protein EAE97_004881 [Botrytis byssoidea]|uniref:Nucleoporin Nup54 alpha-helical domain-containing protein n=1 Tax=Botrytis byssoidea TaxID=139641 RepID=A0A9P5INN0_9HELO|nr:uncharacterized protein EAE97_004881 [Botrytis byssoidea]KAF7945843.1 hypothetical protein EAE97_004881 [Botrytis byssoidea]